MLPDDTSVDALPIVCCPHSKTGDLRAFAKRCSANQLVAAGRKVLREVQVSEMELAFIDRELEENRLAKDGITEKDPTVYLCRRSLGTHLYILGLTEAEIQYVMGHDIEDPYERRNTFVNEDKLYQIKVKMDRRPIVNHIQEAAETEEISPGTVYDHFWDQSQKDFHIVSDSKLQVKLRASSREPMEPIKIHIELPRNGSTSISGDAVSLSEKIQSDRTVNITSQYQATYRKVLSKLDQARRGPVTAESE